MSNLNISDEKWIEISTEMRGSDLPVKQWCKENGFNYKTVLTHEKRLGLQKIRTNPPQQMQSKKVNFAQVKVIEGMSALPSAALQLSVGDITIGVERGFDGDTLRALIKELHTL